MSSEEFDNLFNQDYIIKNIVKEETHAPIIKVIGVGGGGGNAVNYMFRKKIKDVDFVITNTDRQVLLESPIPVKIQLGATLTGGLGTGMDVSFGKSAALESEDEIKAVLGGPTKMVFITAGMGGGTGTGAAPVIAGIAKSMGLLTVSVVTAPYSWEGSQKLDQAMAGIAELQANSDTVLVVLNDKLEELYEDLPLSRAFAQADDILLNAVKSISEIITTSGTINTDFRDVERVLKGARQSVMGTSESEGPDRALTAIEKALDSPLLNDRDISGAQGIIVTIATSSKKEAVVREQRVITSYVTEKVKGTHSLFKLGTITDDSLGDSLRVTIVASGFDKGGKLEIPDFDTKKQPGEKEAQPDSGAAGTSAGQVAAQTGETLYPEAGFSETQSGFVKEEEFELEDTKTGPTVIAVDDFDSKVIYPRHEDYLRKTLYIDQSAKEGWNEAEELRLQALSDWFKSNRNPNWGEFETPAFRRNNLELWQHPDIPASEMEKYNLSDKKRGA
ncbi:MAG: cell division protein FtsZ [Cytophagaceae bacterium SCN 52-12]|nr:MAG: cell division protein FtsZ [Cytophagaceae bacterium SCN 52-12]